VPGTASPEVGTSAVPSAGRADVVRALSESFPRFIRLIHASKSHPGAGDSRETAAQVLLFPISRVGPLRQSTLAELVHADPSTVSRHVAVLVDQGLVQRVADESDGRATRLTLTDAGRATVERLHEERTAQLAAVVEDWADADLTTLTTLFGRLLDDLSAALPPDPRSPSAVLVPRETP
jgi:DNA-binding MarR family transcriptional regulator